MPSPGSSTALCDSEPLSYIDRGLEIKLFGIPLGPQEIDFLPSAIAGLGFHVTLGPFGVGEESICGCPLEAHCDQILPGESRKLEVLPTCPTGYEIVTTGNYWQLPSGAGKHWKRLEMPYFQQTASSGPREKFLLPSPARPCVTVLGRSISCHLLMRGRGPTSH